MMSFLSPFQRIEPYAVGNNRFKVAPESKAPTVGNLSVLNENTAKASSGRLSVSQTSDSLVKETKSLGRLSVSQNSDPLKEQKSLACKTSIFSFWFLLYIGFASGMASRI